MHPDNWISSAEDLLDEIGRAGDQPPSEETIEDLLEQWGELEEKFQETYDNELTTQDQKITMDDLAYAIRGDLVGLRRFVSFESLVRLQRITRRNQNNQAQGPQSWANVAAQPNSAQNEVVELNNEGEIIHRGGRRSKRTRRGRKAHKTHKTHKARKQRKTRKAQKRHSRKARGRRAIQFL